jgi:hypothetical protein
VGNVVEALLVYGFDLGGIESVHGWRFKEVDDNGFAKLPWYTEEEQESEITDFNDYANAFIAEELGRFSKLGDIPEKDRLEVALKRAGVRVVYAGFEYERSVLVAHELSTTPGFDVHVNFRDLSRLQVEDAWSSKLAVALKMMGITPLDPLPRWTLMARYD